jgi:hypothetical protein
MRRQVTYVIRAKDQRPLEHAAFESLASIRRGNQRC